MTSSDETPLGTRRAMTRSRLLLALIALVFVAAACGGSNASDTSAGAEAGSGADQGATSVVLPTSDGGQLDFGDLEGQPTLLWFWAPW